MAIGFATAFCFAAAGASARGLFLETAPWQGVAIADTVLGFSAGMVVTTGDTSAVLFPVGFSPIRRGPLRIALAWSAQSVRNAEQRVFGFGDPKLFVAAATCRCDSAVRSRFYAEGAVRIPTASAKLFPYANGGQELELAASFDSRRGWLVARWWRSHLDRAGAGSGIGQSPTCRTPSTGGRGIAPRRGRLRDALARRCAVVRQRRTSRGLFEGIIAYTGTNGLRLEARGGAEVGAGATCACWMRSSACGS